MRIKSNIPNITYFIFRHVRIRIFDNSYIYAYVDLNVFIIISIIYYLLLLVLFIMIIYYILLNHGHQLLRHNIVDTIDIIL